MTDTTAVENAKATAEQHITTCPKCRDARQDLCATGEDLLTQMVRERERNQARLLREAQRQQGLWATAQEEAGRLRERVKQLEGQLDAAVEQVRNERQHVSALNDEVERLLRANTALDRKARREAAWAVEAVRQAVEAQDQVKTLEGQLDEALAQARNERRRGDVMLEAHEFATKRADAAEAERYRADQTVQLWRQRHDAAHERAEAAMTREREAQRRMKRHESLFAVLSEANDLLYDLLMEQIEGPAGTSPEENRCAADDLS